MHIFCNEIFSSVQGEGPFVGQRQIFIRLAGCNLSCRYCDTPIETSDVCKIEKIPGGKDFYTLANPLKPETIMQLVNTYNPSLHHSISITGGEPLLHTNLLIDLIPRLPNTRKGIFLETNGTLPEELKKVIKLVDYVSMDIKIDNAGWPTNWEIHQQFLTVAADRNVFVKVVVSQDTTIWQITRAVGIIAEQNKKIPFILQPVTPANDIKKADNKKMLLLQEIALRYLEDVRIIPQTHVMLDYL